VRDLTARQTQSKLNTTEKRALDRFKDRLLLEWAASMGIEIDEARQRLEKRLQPPASAD
jgi:RNA polymerase-interacting CarD/CdnL/TRCF family regulator